MTTPVRLQLSRRKGLNLQAWSRAVNGLSAIKADRSTKLGNPFPIVKCESISMGVTKNIWAIGTWNGPAMWFRDTKPEALALSVDAYRAWITAPQNASKLNHAIQMARGKNLACWCALDKPCHADVLLELARGAQT